MSKEMIGLKLADGEFYPVLEDAVAARKRLVVTTVQDGQRSVQIDLYRGTGKRVEGAEYIGSLVIEDIPDMPKGEPDIRMDLGLTEDGTLTAFAQEASTGASQSLKVSLKSLAEEDKYEVPDFKFSGSTPLTEVFDTDEMTKVDMTEDVEANVLSTQDDSAQLLAGVHDESDSDFGSEPRKKKTGVIIAAIVAAAVVLAVLGFLLLRPSSGAQPVETPVATSQAEPEATQTPSTETASETAISTETTPTVDATSAQAQDASAATAATSETASSAETAPAQTSVAPQTSTEPDSGLKPGVNYKIKWGDTLWELSYAFYRNPWYFGKIALANGIKNPDKIIAGRTIWIPPL